MQVLDRFHSIFKWNISGSVVFELLKLIHNALLLRFLSPYTYGSMGAIFAITYFASRIIESGAAYSVPPFFQKITQSRQYLISGLLFYYFMPLIPIGTIVASIATILYWQKFSHNIYIFLLPILMVLEAARSVMRQFLHTAFQSYQAIFAELGLFIGYLLIVWGGFFVGGFELSLNYLFVPYLLDSIIGLLLFAYLIYNYYSTLPIAPAGSIMQGIPLKDFVHMRFFNFLLKTSRDLFTSNFITPLFAIKFGLAEAGVFYFASTLATAFNAVIKASIGYSGSALLANIKNDTLENKRFAFKALSKKLMLILTPLICIFGLNYKQFFVLSASSGMTQTTISFAACYLLITFSEFFFVLYEQFYLVEEASHRLFYCKTLEFCLLFCIISLGTASTPITLLLQIIVVRLLSFFVIALQAYKKWGIRPKFRTSLSYSLSSIFIALIIKIMLLVKA